MLHQYFHVKVNENRQKANVLCKVNYQQSEINMTEESIIQFLKEQKVIYGINHKNVRLITTSPPTDKFPLTVASGNPVKHGTNGNITYKARIDIEKTHGITKNFRDIMKLPMVEKGQQLATISEPTDGTDGWNVYGEKVSAEPGKPCRVNAGKNVVYRKENNSFYATMTGQLVVSNKVINVEEVYEIHETLSMRKGNIDFNGSIVVHGDVPTGYIVNANQDIKVFGIAEGATLIAGGSIYISEGMAGLKKGMLQAGKDIHLGYLNQGNVKADGSIHVENAIFHSQCDAGEHLYSEHGNIIGGSTSAGKSIEAKNIGNRMNTKTWIMFGMNESIHEKEDELLTQKKELESSLQKLLVIGEKLAIEKSTTDAKRDAFLLRQRHSFLKTSEALQKVDTELDELYAAIGSEYEAFLKINGQLHENVRITFGKYNRNIQNPRECVKILLLDKEIVIRDLI